MQGWRLTGSPERVQCRQRPQVGSGCDQGHLQLQGDGPDRAIARIATLKRTGGNSELPDSSAISRVIVSTIKAQRRLPWRQLDGGRHLSGPLPSAALLQMGQLPEGVGGDGQSCLAPPPPFKSLACRR